MLYTFSNYQVSEQLSVYQVFLNQQVVLQQLNFTCRKIHIS